MLQGQWWERLKDKHRHIFHLIQILGNIGSFIGAIPFILGSGLVGYLLAVYGNVTAILGEYGSAALIFMTFLGWTSALYVSLRYGRSNRLLRENLNFSRREAEKALQQLHEAQTQRAIIETNQKSTLIRFNNISLRFYRFARHNAQCDKGLFDVFHTQMMRRPVPEGPLITAINHVDRNIDEILTSARTIFLQLTGKACAICIKTVDPDPRHPVTSFYDLKVDTLRRDSYSATLPRAENDKTRVDFVRDNTADRHVFTPTGREYLNDVWANDDLLELKRKGQYDNARDNRYEDYTATVVAGIFNLDDQRNAPWRGLFCIDNTGGGLDNDVAKYYARELAARVSIMVYRLDVLQKIKENYDTRRRYTYRQE
jgi:hypothetical protein